MYFFDRKKTIVRRSGENIGVLESKARSNGHPYRRLRGNARSRRHPREEVFAFIVPNAEIGDAATLADSIVKTCAERLAYHKVPGYIAIVDELPLSSTRKLARGEIKTLAAEAVGANARSTCVHSRQKLRHA